MSRRRSVNGQCLPAHCERLVRSSLRTAGRPVRAEGCTESGDSGWLLVEWESATRPKPAPPPGLRSRPQPRTARCPRPRRPVLRTESTIESMSQRLKSPRINHLETHALLLHRVRGLHRERDHVGRRYHCDVASRPPDLGFPERDREVFVMHFGRRVYCR